MDSEAIDSDDDNYYDEIDEYPSYSLQSCEFTLMQEDTIPTKLHKRRNGLYFVMLFHFATPTQNLENKLIKFYAHWSELVSAITNPTSFVKPRECLYSEHIVDEMQNRIIESMIERATALGEDYVRDTIVSIRVDVEIRKEENDMEQALRESLEVIKFVGATDTSICALENIIVQDLNECVVCRKDFYMGEEVTRMPCSHFYHTDCIVQWLKTNHLCPLCRFEMPSS